MQHLCQALNVQTFFVHPDLSNTISDTGLGPRIIQIPPDLNAAEHMPFVQQLEDCRISSMAYICHSSGTASGLPKPIYQSQHGVICCLYPFPRNEDARSQPATFTVTPLYHGGTPDCLRSWSSGALCWLFPQGSVPTTGANVINSVQAARMGGVGVCYFSSVPFVLQMLLDEDREAGLCLLKTFDLVGYGGAALPRSVGDRLVKAGVNLLSRMGSAECGFLMSSHRDYANDKEWEYLRPIDDDSLLSFESREEGLSELVVREKWPFKTKTNYDAGKAYATADLFERHHCIPYAWRYHGRADAQIVLANGKKFDPVPMESDIMAAAAGTGLRDILIFGTDMSQAGALLFPLPNNDDVTEKVWSIIEEMNHRSQSHARIAKTMLIVIPADEADDPPLPKSSKGTIMRARAEAIYERQIKLANPTTLDSTPVPDDQLYGVVLACFDDRLGREIDVEQDLYQQGVDSIACVQIRSSLEQRRLVEKSLPLNVIYNERTVSGLVDYLLKLRHGATQDDGFGGRAAELKTMKELASKHGTFAFSEATRQDTQVSRDGNIVVLTGATGFLGAHILDHLRREPSVSKIFCLVRAAGSQEARERVSKTLIQYHRDGLDKSNNSLNPVKCLACRLSETDLGLSEDDKKNMLDEATEFIHAAWTVNFNLGLYSFQDQMIGTKNLVNAAGAAHAKLFFLSSTAAVSAASATASIPESLSTDPSDASPLGYSQSKWVTEQICDTANKAAASPFVSVIRVGQLCANEEGVWNASEAYPLMLSTARLTGSLPLIEDKLDWIPVEVAAQAVLDIIRHKSQNPVTAVYHVINPHDGPPWSMLLQRLIDAGDCTWLQMVPPDDWMDKLEKALIKDEYRDHPSQALVNLWKTAYCSERGLKTDERTPNQIDGPRFDISQTQAVSSTMKDIKALDIVRIDKIWAWLSRTLG